MNPGYISILLMLVSLILFASGWKDIILRGIARPSLLLFFVFWAAGARATTNWNGWEIYGCVWLLIILIAIGLVRTPGALLMRLHVFSVGMLLGSISFFLRETVHLIPRMTIIHNGWTMALILGWLGAVLLRSPILQLTAISVGLLIGEGLYGVYHQEQTRMIMGGREFQDQWWLAVFAVRGFSLLFSGTVFGAKKLWSVGRSGWQPQEELSPTEEDPAS